MSNLIRLSVFFLIMCGSSIFCHDLFAARYVEFEVLIDGKVAMETSRGDQGAEPDVVWDYLRTLTLRPVKDYMITPDANDPLKSTLKGKIVIDAPYGGRVEVSELILVRDPKDPKKWSVAPKEVERTKKIRKKPQ